jgi:hypothetical protein
MHFVSQLHDLLLDVQSRQASAKGVILQRDWRPEQRHDAVTGELVDRAAVASSNRCRAAEDVAHYLAQPLRSQGRGNRQGIHYVGEQHGHLLELRQLSRFRRRLAACVAEPGAVAQLIAARSAYRACWPHPPLPPLISGRNRSIIDRRRCLGSPLGHETHAGNTFGRHHPGDLLFTWITQQIDDNEPSALVNRAFYALVSTPV